MLDDDITCLFEGVLGVGAIYISNLAAAQNVSLLRSNPLLTLGLEIRAIVTAVKGAIVTHSKEDVTDHLYIPAHDNPAQDISKYF